ncbi:hypothetical protein CVT24_000267 [Panaeolus cyanescens]|uniref:Transposase domain-containing protein n=1 Tax=Panaeolus cyanescens TaxID=181874 RepID=A0A409YDA3_9AGAR|nr:hypothetical protein CVT24_000267 [Panaeolus cyanescens]
MAEKEQNPNYGICNCCGRYLHKKTIRQHAQKKRTSMTINARASVTDQPVPRPASPDNDIEILSNEAIPQIDSPQAPRFNTPEVPIAGPSRLPLEAITPTPPPAASGMRHRYTTRFQKAVSQRWHIVNDVLQQEDMFNLDSDADSEASEDEDDPGVEFHQHNASLVDDDEEDSDEEDDGAAANEGPHPIGLGDIPLDPGLAAAARAIEEAQAENIMRRDYDARIAEGALDEANLAFLRPYILKVEQHLTEKTFSYLPQVFPKSAHSTLKQSKKHVGQLSRFDSVKYDCCVSSCVCFVGPYTELDKCPICSENRYTPRGKPRKTFQYIPLIPRLKAMTSNHKIAEKMQYRAKYQHKEGSLDDIFDGNHYRELLTTTVRDQPMFHFSDPRDIALGLSTDGFGPFKHRKHTCWPIILFNYNIPPEERMHKQFIINVGTIPGPKKPKDWDSFCFPLVQELLKLELGVKAFDPISRKSFDLHAYLLLAFGNMPTVSLMTRMKGQNGRSPCRFCNIKGCSHNRTYYVPLKHSSPKNPCLYDPANLPLRTPEELDAQIAEIEAASTAIQKDKLSKEYGVKGKALLSTLSSISIPNSFPLDFMHLIWENLLPNLIAFWTGQFKNLVHEGMGYIIDPKEWKKIGELTAKAGQTIPSSYGARIPNIATHQFYVIAESYSNWTLFIAPIVLRNRLASKYYKHFMQLCQLILQCISFNITEADLESIESGFRDWVQKYEKYYYLDKHSQLPACPVTIHSLLHIADGMCAAGPVSCYWAFPMERHCSTLLPAARSRRHPYVAISNFSTAAAQLDQIRLLYDVSLSLEPEKPPDEPPDLLKLNDPDEPLPSPLVHPEYPGYYLLAPAKHKTLSKCVRLLVWGHLITRFSDDEGKRPAPTKSQVKNLLKTLHQDRIAHYGRVRIGDHVEKADQVVAADMNTSREDSRDSTWVKYVQLVDEEACSHGAPSRFKPWTFYGQLKSIFILDIPAAPNIHIPEPCQIILALVHGARITVQNNMHIYKDMGAVELVDVATLRSVVGHMHDGKDWYIIDRS